MRPWRRQGGRPGLPGAVLLVAAPAEVPGSGVLASGVMALPGARVRGAGVAPVATFVGFAGHRYAIAAR